MTREFDIPLDNHRRMFGAFLAAHAIPDAVDVLFTGVGCKSKAQRQLAMHDRVREAGNKMVWADVGDVQLISGPAERLRDMTVETVRRRGNVGLVLITDSAAMELTGTDVEAVLPAIRRQVGCPVVHVGTAGWDGDAFLGYAEAVSAVFALPSWKAARGDRRSVNVVGYVFDRYEHDHAANLIELRRLLEGLGLRLNATFLSGVPLRSLLGAPAAGVNLLLPYARSMRATASRTARRPAAPCVLPVGLGGTARFLEDAARGAGVPVKAARARAAEEGERLGPALRVAREGLAGVRVGILADTPTAAGLAGLLRELGAEPVLAGLLDRSLGGDEGFRETLAAAGHDAGACVVLPDPTAQEVESACGELRHGARARGGRPFDVLIAPDLWLPRAATDGTARLELGFASNRRHAVAPSPFLGFSGVLSLAQRLLDAAHRVH
ncbi:MAG: hypothetical protein HY905_26780 [Deltaproteobacteria bacterium]|nr:hypothetical protein [Deltaproteobacteria bacterium]